MKQPFDMNIVMKILGIAILIAIGVGFYFRMNNNIPLGDRFIGIAVLASAFVLMPIFLYVRWKGKRLEDYTLSDKNIKKMQERNKD
ncbi:hypothetical protein [Autumnicola musiva]|uniref:Uncharacterized protein n=1 Tax=Autumnicola musiva TaxID=3075589 RepID=A0ABU3D0U9_9FLAO|nr:hypothetical protein [Zunongwangia sp. F117]MDT0675175.1 hypothetical protein [Zunongwangia sp. F117]